MKNSLFDPTTTRREEGEMFGARENEDDALSHTTYGSVALVHSGSSWHVHMYLFGSPPSFVRPLPFR